jgi:hypothetical protein
MISPMPHRRRLATMIWAAIFVIAAQFFAGPAFAHASHSHGHSTAAHSSAVQVSNHAPTSTFSAVRLPGLGHADLSLSAPPEGADMPVVPQSNGCTGGCCGNGLGCCGAVLAVALSPIPDTGSKRETVSHALNSESGMAPEGLRRPPRTLA